jgi:hypothetical protein
MILIVLRLLSLFLDKQTQNLRLFNNEFKNYIKQFKFVYFNLDCIAIKNMVTQKSSFKEVSLWMHNFWREKNWPIEDIEDYGLVMSGNLIL